jgi:signal transduction histidine kinase
MRRFAGDIFTARNIEFSFDARGAERSFRIGTDARRQVFLIFKEGVNNIARHSRCKQAHIELTIRDGWLLLELNDDGKGFDPGSSSEGNGLASMRTRAERLGGELQVTSQPGAGTKVRVKASLSPQLPRRDGRAR